MCGIAGYIGPTPPEDAAVTRCLSAMRHRGPDGRGRFTARTPHGTYVTLLHSRLSILDLDPRADQPMRRDGRVLIFNGELYNFVELRERFAQTGMPFLTTGDSEVLLAALTPQGKAVLGVETATQALNVCEGMWAFALYDEATGQLLLCRDRFGEKPLYLLRTPDGGLYFGSEPNFLAALSGTALRPNHNHIKRFLVNGYKALYKTDETFFHDVTELPAGTALLLTARDAQTLRYWTPPSAAKPQEMSFAEAVSGVRERLLRSMELRLRSDVPLAFCMSGGIDSNSLICIARRVFDYDVHGFTVMNTDARYEERACVELVVRELGIRHTAVTPSTQNFLPNLRELVRAHDAPIYTISYYVHWLLMRRIREQGYTISLSGTGADELFSGYYDHHNLYLAALHAEAPSAYPDAVAAWREHVAPIVRNPYLQEHDVFVRTPSERGHIFLHNDQYAAALTAPWHEPFAETPYPGNLLRKRMLNELFHEAVPVILHEDDLNAMYYSIENRSPFLDRALFEHSLSIPTRHLVQNGRAKAVLREAMRGIVPDEILDNRRKVGFNAPVMDFLALDDTAVRAEILADSPLWEIMRREAVEALLNAGQRADTPLGNSDSKFLFNALCCKMFLEEHA